MYFCTFCAWKTGTYSRDRPANSNSRYSSLCAREPRFFESSLVDRSFSSARDVAVPFADLASICRRPKYFAMPWSECTTRSPGSYVRNASDEPLLAEARLVPR